MGLGDVVKTISGLSNASKFDLLLEQIAEAKRETEHLQRALRQMELICRQGADTASADYGNRQRDLMSSFDADLRRLDGWVISLVETDLSMVEIISPPGNPLKKTIVLDQIRRALARSPWGFAY
jgi:hypothetical protein